VDQTSPLTILSTLPDPLTKKCSTPSCSRPASGPRRIRQYGAALDLTPGSESDVILVLDRTQHYKKDPKNKVLAQRG
jgi:hypothetical protein